MQLKQHWRATVSGYRQQHAWNYTGIYFLSNLFLLNFIFQFLKFRTFPCKRVDLLLIFERNIRIFSSDLQTATNKKDITSCSLQWKKIRAPNGRSGKQYESFFYSTFRLAFAILVCVLSNRVKWKMRTLRCLDARVTEIFYHANELWSPRQSVISCVEHNLFISFVRTQSYDHFQLLQEINVYSFPTVLLWPSISTSECERH